MDASRAPRAYGLLSRQPLRDELRRKIRASGRHDNVLINQLAVRDFIRAREDRFILDVLRQAGLTREQLARIERANLG
jgi:hypothetical protein